MVSVVISIGSNYGDRKASILYAIEWLRKEVLSQMKVSDIYETPCALNGDKTYLNAVVSGYYQGTGIDLEDLLKDKEHKMGRTFALREKRLVPIDIDLVVMNGSVVKDWDFRQNFFQIGYNQIQS